MKRKENKINGWIVAVVIAVVIVILPKAIQGIQLADSFISALLTIGILIGWLVLSWLALTILLILVAYVSVNIYRKAFVDELVEKEKRDLVMNHIYGMIIVMSAIIVLVAHFMYCWNIRSDMFNSVLSFIFPLLRT